jgi:serine/threonine protein phosphatase PrpC
MEVIGISSFGATDPGKERETNEDRFHCDPDDGIFIVIDGMGGEVAGDLAADIALKHLRLRLKSKSPSAEVRIREAIVKANNEIYRKAESDSTLKGMGCVLTCAVIEEDQITIGHVGDSRCYVIRDRKIKKLTHDHSPVGVAEDRHELTEEEAMLHPDRNEVLRHVGLKEQDLYDNDFIEIIEEQFDTDIALVLCSDGLSDMLTSTEISDVVMKTAGKPEQVVQKLISSANEKGGKDNIAVVFIEGSKFAESIRKPRITNRILPARSVNGNKNKSPESESRIRAANNISSPSIINEKLTKTEREEQTSKISRATLGERARRIWTNRWVVLSLGFILGISAVLVIDAVRSPRKVGSTDQPINDIKANRLRVITVGNSEQADYKQIGEAIDNAPPGSTVLVAPGQYQGPITLRNGISLVSQNPGGAVILLNELSNAVLAVNAKDSLLIGFKIQGSEVNPSGVGLRVIDSNLSISGVEISGLRTGVELYGNSVADLVSCYIHDNSGSGIVIHDRAMPRIIRNLLRHNGLKDKKAAIDITDGSKPTIEENAFVSNVGENIAGVGDKKTEVRQKNFFLIEQR